MPFEGADYLKHDKLGWNGKSMDSRKWEPCNMNQAGKGCVPRNKSVSPEEEDLRWRLAFGKISEEEFNKAMKDLHGKETN